MTDDERINAIVPNAAALVCAVTDADPAAVHDAIGHLTTNELHAMLVLLAANVPDDSPLAMRDRPPASVAGVVDAVLEEVSATFNLRRDIILSTDRHREVGVARQVAMAACRLAGLSSVATGKAFGRDHSTVLHAATRVGEDPRLQAIARRIALPLNPTPGLLGDELSEVA